MRSAGGAAKPLKTEAERGIHMSVSRASKGLLPCGSEEMLSDPVRPTIYLFGDGETEGYPPQRRFPRSATSGFGLAKMGR